MAATAAALVVLPSGAALAHSAFLGSSPQPGQRLSSTPSGITLTFTEPLDRRLSLHRHARR